MDLNVVEIAGTVVERKSNYATLRGVRRSGKDNVIRLWDLPMKAKVGDHVMVTGRLQIRQIGFINVKFILGVEVSKVKVLTKEDTVSKVVISGKITCKGKKRTTSFGKRFIEISVNANGAYNVPVIVWNTLADLVEEEFKIGDDVKIAGLLLSREYDKAVMGRVVKRLTTEVNAYSIKKV